MLTLRYFGSFEVWRGDAPVALPTRPCARLLALLATEPGRRWRREAIAREVWPDAEWGTDTVSLRTALSMLRRELGPTHLETDRETVRIQGTASDFARFDQLRRREEREGDGERREALLAELAETSIEFLEGWDASWAVALRNEHHRAIATVTLELARLRLTGGLPEEARRFARRSLAARPRHPGALALAMRAEAALGDYAEASALLARSFPNGPPAELAALEGELARSPSRAPAAPTLEFVRTAFEAGIVDDPETALSLVVASRRFWWRQSDLASGVELLTRGLAAPGLPTELRARGLITLSQLHHRAGRSARAIACAEEGLALVPADSELGIELLGTLVQPLTATRRWEETGDILRRVLAILSPNDPRWTIFRIYQGREALQHMRLDDAERIFAEALVPCDASDFHGAWDFAYVDLLRAWIAGLRGDWPLAERLAGRARAFFTLDVDSYIASSAEALVLLARVAQGDRSAGLPLARTAYTPLRAGMPRPTSLALEYAALGLAHLGQGRSGMELLTAVGELRVQQGFPRSPADVALVEAARELARESPGDAPLELPREVGALVGWTIHAFERVGAGPVLSAHESLAIR